MIEKKNRKKTLLGMCSYCKDIRISDVADELPPDLTDKLTNNGTDTLSNDPQWLAEQDDPSLYQSILELYLDPLKVSHGACPDCYKTQMEKIESIKKTQYQ